jgi:uncharacterized protein YjbI with pentapeptide repeats
VNQFNQQHNRLQVLLSGREMVVQANSDLFRKSGQILHFLPYFVPEDERDNRNDTSHTYLDEHNLLATDRRQEWWQHYGTESGLGYTHMPQELDRGNLTEITSQPLLNYLVALSYQQGKVKITPESNLNEIYQNLLTAVYERGWAGKDARHPAIENITQSNFERILEEMALASWHGDGRTTTVKDIEARCENSGLQYLLEGFQDGAKSGVIRLLTAFYFRQSGQRDGGDKTFEFTHKSFGEYLTARRLVRGLQCINQGLEDRKANFDRGLDPKRALERWAELAGPSRMDADLFKFLLDEVKLRYHNNPELVAQWQQNLCRLIEVMLRNGMPMEKLSFATFHEANRQARNAEEALLIALNACASCTEIVSQIAWGESGNFGNWLARIQGQRIHEERPLALRCLSFLDLSDCILNFRDLCWADLRGAILKGTSLDRVHLNSSYLVKACLDGASLNRANLNGVLLHNASLEKANLEGANLEGANLSDANLNKANLNRANLNLVMMGRARLKGASLEEASLEAVILVRANLNGAYLGGANLNGADLERADLEGANLEDANLLWTNLNRADLAHISWNEDTSWEGVIGLETANNVPTRLKQQLGIA